MPSRELWVAIDATIRRNAKLTDLPSDTARWGWIAALGEAKLQRPQGRFRSRSSLAESLGRFARFLDEYVSHGLLEATETLCARCSEVWGPLPTSGFVVHDWSLHQLDPSESGDPASPGAVRMRRWRQRHGDVTRDVTSDARDVTVETSLARAVSVSHSVTVNVTSENERAGEEVADLPPLTRIIDYLEERTGRQWHGRPGQPLWDFLKADVDQVPTDEILAAYRSIAGTRVDFAKLIYGGHNLLYPLSGAVVEKRQTPEERERAEAKARNQQFKESRAHG